MDKPTDKERPLYWLISLPNKPGAFEANQKRTEREAALCQNYRFPIASELRVGTLDSLMALSDDLIKIDTFVEATVRKISRAFYEFVEKAEPMVKSGMIRAF